MPSLLKLPLAWLYGLGLALALVGGQAAAAEPDPDLVFKPPRYWSAVLSPSGRHLALLTPVDGRMQLAVLNLDSMQMESRIGVPDADVGPPLWLGDERLVFSLDQYGQSRQQRLRVGGLFVVGRDGKEQRKLFQTAAEWFATGARRYVQTWPVRAVPGQANALIVASNDVDENSVDLYRMDALTGKRQHLTKDRPPRVKRWVLDEQLRPRVAIGDVADNALTLVVHYREADGPWRELWRMLPTREDVSVPLSVEADGKLLVASNRERNTTAIREYDPAKKLWGDILVEHPDYDVAIDALGDPAGEQRWHESRHELLGFQIDAARPQQVWMDERRQAMQALVDKALPERINTLQFSASSRVLVSSWSDTVPQRWYLLERDKEGNSKLNELLQSRPDVDPAQQPRTEAIKLQSRDGQPLLSYLVKPADAPAGKALPTIVLVHGGPWDRGPVWGDDTGDMGEARWFARQGYQVLLPSFRGSMGFGKALLRSSRGQFGLSMQDDIDDQLEALLKRGDVDARRICIVGASYGGYASLMAAARAPERYRCVVAGMPVSDLPALLDSGWSDLSSDEHKREFWVEMVGDPKARRKELEAVSPVHLAARIKARVLLYAGIDDRRTPLEQAAGMRKALQRAGNEPLWLAKYGEGHGFRLTSNRRELLALQKQFIAEQIGPQAKP